MEVREEGEAQGINLGFERQFQCGEVLKIKLDFIFNTRRLNEEPRIILMINSIYISNRILTFLTTLEIMNLNICKHLNQ